MSNKKLKEYCDRIFRLKEEIANLNADVKSIQKDAENDGYDKALIAKTVALMLKSEGQRAKALEQMDLLDTYLLAAGVLPINETPANSGGSTEGDRGIAVAPSVTDQQQMSPLPVAEVALKTPATRGGVDAQSSSPAPILDDKLLSQYDHAVLKVLESRNPSTSFLQHAMDLPYSLATSFIDDMERDGIISAPQANGKRAVFEADDIGNIPPALDRRKPKPTYTAEQLLGSG